MNYDLYLNDCFIGAKYNGIVNNIDEGYALLAEGYIDLDEYDFICEASAKDMMEVAKKYLKADVKDIPKMIKDAKREANIKKFNDAFKLKEVFQNGKKKKTIEIEGLRIVFFENKNGVIAATTDVTEHMIETGNIETRTSGVGEEKFTAITVSPEFFNLPLDTQKVILYHEFGHMRLHSFGSSGYQNTTSREDCEKVLDSLMKTAYPGSILTKDENGKYKSSEIQDIHDKYMAEIEKEMKKLGDMPTNKKRAMLIDKYKDAMKQSVTGRKILKKNEQRTANSIKAKEEFRKAMEEEKATYHGAEHISKEMQNEKLGIKAREKTEKARIANNKAKCKEYHNINHYQPTEIEADQYAVKKVGAKKAKKALGRKMMHEANKSEFKAATKDMPAIQKMGAKLATIPDAIGANRELKARREVIDILDRDRKNGIKQAKRDAKAKKKAAKAALKESVYNYIFDELGDYYTEGYISERCYYNTYLLLEESVTKLDDLDLEDMILYY